MRFAAVEGLRAPLAWMVVVSHCAQAAETSETGIFYYLRLTGPLAVDVFIIVSGFVITHLLLQKRESYLAYLIRRFFRLFPLFAVMCVIGFFTMPLYVRGLAQASWHPYAVELYGGIVKAQTEHLWQHALAHLTMLHGLFAHSKYAFLPPAWSISLEWQFYLVAPLVLLVARYSTVLFVAIAVCLFSFSAPLFAIGIAGRLLWKGEMAVPVLTHPIMQFWGARSYSVYLTHFSVLSIVIFILPEMPAGGFFFAVLPITVVGTGLVSIATYRFIEQPGIKLGHLLARKPVDFYALWA